MSLIHVYTPAMFNRVASLVLGFCLLLPANTSAATVHPGAIKATVSGSSVTVSWGPIPSDIGYTNGMYEAFLGKPGFHNDGSPEDYKATCRTAPTVITCTMKNIPAGNWDVVVYATSTSNKSYSSKAISIRVGKAPPTPAVGVACAMKGEVTKVKGKYLECGKSKRWQQVQVGRACVLQGSLAGELFCRIESGRGQWVGPAVAKCAGAAESIRAAALKCMLARYGQNKPNTSVKVTLKASPTTHKSAITWINKVLKDSMRMYGSYPGVGAGTIHAYFSLDKEWCLDQLQQLTGNRDEYLCEQDGGLNAGSLFSKSGWVKRESLLFGRPFPGNPSLQVFTQLGANSLLNDNDWALHFVYEMGHATHGLLMSEITGDGQTGFVPVLLEVGAARMAAYAYVVGVLRESETRWRATLFERNSPTSGLLTPYSDPRLSSGGSYQGDAIEWPRVYTLGFLAGEYIVGKYGDEVLFDRLIPAVMRNRGDFDAALRATIGIGEDELYAALNQYALEQLRAAGHSVTQK